MKKFPFLLLDAGPIIKLFELGLWDFFVESCDVTITRTVADEAKYASGELEDIRIDLDEYEGKGRIKITDLNAWQVKEFGDKFDLCYRAIMHDGERETLAFLAGDDKGWRLCSSDGAVYRVLGLLGRGESGISLEEILSQIGRSAALNWQYSKAFRVKYTMAGQADSIQGKGLV